MYSNVTELDTVIQDGVKSITMSYKLSLNKSSWPSVTVTTSGFLSLNSEWISHDVYISIYRTNRKPGCVLPTFLEKRMDYLCHDQLWEKVH